MVNVVLAGGGSAGHTSPLIATAEELIARQATVSCVGTRGKLEERVIPEAGLELDFIPRVPFPRRPNPAAVAFPARLTSALQQARRVLQRRRADVVVGFGGYVSTPMYLAARSLRIPVIIHEQNALPGLANKLGARFARHVGTTYRGTDLPHATYVGLPLRRAIATLDRAADRAAARSELGLDGDRLTVLVSGGSLGARSINTAVEAAIGDLLSHGIDVVHVWGLKNFRDDLTRRTDEATGASYVPLPFVDRMQTAYAAADLMIGRAGSNTVNETAVVGLPQIYVPLPIGNGEQEHNAREFVAAGCGVMLSDASFDAETLRREVFSLVDEPGRLEAMSRAGRTLVPSDAAARVATWAIDAGERG